MDRDIETIEVRLFLEALHARYGYDLRDYAGPSMRRRVLAALANSGLAHLGELQHKVLTDPAFFATTLEMLTIRVSELFRDPEFFKSLRTHVVPILRTYPLIRIWHAGCANGEEVYGMAILLAEEGLYERAQIYATDLSYDALTRAKQGIYPAEQVPTFNANYVAADGKAELSTYYTAAYDHIAMKESLRRNVVFFEHNLVSDHVFGEMHLILCRNVLIYFGPELRGRVTRKLDESLTPRGFICLGTSERLMPSATEHRYTDMVPEQHIYRRET